MYKEIDSNKRNTFFLIFFFIIFIIALGWALSYIFDNQGILIIAVIIAVTQSWISYYYADKLVLMMSRARGPIKKEDNPELYRLVENLCLAAGLPMPKIYVISDSAPNAFATGRNPEHAVVCISPHQEGRAFDGACIIARVVLECGMPVYLLRDPELPIINITAMVRTGSVYEPAAKSGLAGLTGSVMRSGGAGGLSPEKMDDELEFMASS
ncbi:MAG: membrane protease, partial [Candidatus Berkelbacteria bacterium Licking1014_96]